MSVDDLFAFSADFPFPGESPQEAGSAGANDSETAPATETVSRGPSPVTGSAGAANPLPGTGGVYLLTDSDDRIIQLASSGNLRQAIQTRLLNPGSRTEQGSGVTGRRRADLREIVRKIRWRPACSAFEINHEYWRISRVLQPETYSKLLGFGPAWFIHADPTAMIPRFLVGKLLRESPGVNLGPFFTHSDATRFVQVLEDGFDLCRYPQILEQSPHGKACAYFDMGRCPAPCDGTLPMSRYRESVEEAVRFAIADREGVYGRCEAAMREAASRQSYEQAGRIKQRLARLREIEHKAFAHVGPIEQFNWLIVQRGGGRTKVRPFFVQAGMITPGQTVSLRELDKAVAKWLESPIRESRTTACQGLDELQSRSEQIWLVSHYLGKSKTPGLFLHANRLPSCADLAARIRECFRKPEPPTEVDPPSGMPEPASPPST